jgi:O-antigen ligase
MVSTERGHSPPVPRRLRAVDVDLSLVLFLAAALVVRVLTDDLSAPDSRHSGSLNLSADIALLFMLLASGLLLRRRRGLLATILATLWLGAWTAVAVHTNGASTETLREGVREASVVALAVIAYNACGAVTVPLATRLVQLVGFVPAIVALYQLATFTGANRAYGTFAHPDSAAMFFAIAVIASLWLYQDNGRRRADAMLVILFAAALIATFSIDGLGTLVAMLVAYGVLHPGSPRLRVVPCVIAGAVVVVFFASPLGARRIASESSNKFASTGEPDSSLAWRLEKWKSLVPEWERSPVFGRGLGTTTTGDPDNRLASKPPHNEYIRYAVETGVVGLAILLWAVALLTRHLFRKRRIPGELSAGTFNAPALAIVVVLGCLVNSLADNTLLNSPTGYAAALIVAAVLALPGIDAPRAAVPQAV